MYKRAESSTEESIFQMFAEVIGPLSARRQCGELSTSCIKTDHKAVDLLTDECIKTTIDKERDERELTKMQSVMSRTQALKLT